MAKDKSKKSAANDDFAKPSEATGGGDSWSLTDGDDPKSGQNDGKLFLFTPLRTKEVSVTRGKKTEDVEVVVSDIVELNEKKPAKSEEHEEVFVWAKWVQGSIREHIGKRQILGRLVKTADSGSAVGYVWKLEDADADDVAVAREYLASLSPFPDESGKKKAKGVPVETKSSKKSKDAEPEKPAKKSKKAKK